MSELKNAINRYLEEMASQRKVVALDAAMKMHPDLKVLSEA